MVITFYMNKLQTQRWYHIDAKNFFLGKLSVNVSSIVRGFNKNKFNYIKNYRDVVVITNSKSIQLTGKKYLKKNYMFYSGYFGNEKHVKFKDFFNKNSNKVLFLSIKRMLPKNKLMGNVLKNIKIYPEEEHPHLSQKSKLIFCS